MQWNVQKIGPQAQNAGAYGELIVDRKDFIKGYHQQMETAVGEAKALASAHPGDQFAVFGIVSIFETTKPTFVEKVLNEAGELIIKPAVTA